jgi:hypothetical protein
LISLSPLFLQIRKGFSIFFALSSADLEDFSALVLAAVAASKALLEASNSASRDAIRALAIAKASIVKNRENEYGKEAKKDA